MSQHIGPTVRPPNFGGGCASGLNNDHNDKILTSGDGDIGEIEHGISVPKMLPDPGTPSRQEVLEHELTHLPVRSWCPHCVAARAKNQHIPWTLGRTTTGCP